MNITLHMMDKNDIELVRHRAPREELVKRTRAKHRGLLAIDTDDMVPAGIMICSYVRADHLDIEWLFVHENYRNNEIGEELLIAAYDMAMKAKIPYVGVRMAGELAADENVERAADYFVARGFYRGTYVEGDWIMSAAKLNDSPLASGKYRLKNVFPISKASRADLRVFLQKNWKKLKQSPLYTYESAMQDMDQDLSMVCVNGDGEIEDILLVQRAGDIVYPLAIHMSHVSQKIFRGLATGLTDAAKSLSDDLIYHIVYSKRAASLMVKIFNSYVAVPTYLMLAPADFYEHEKEDMESGGVGPYDYMNSFHLQISGKYDFAGYEFHGVRYD